MMREGRVALGTAVVGLAALLGGSFLMPKDYLPDEQVFPRTQVEDLIVNRDDSIMTYAELTPKQATNDMLALVYSSEFEEAWVEVYKKGLEAKPFFEIGIHNFIDMGKVEQTGLHFNNPLVNELMRGQKKLRFWHDHPQRDFEKVLKEEWRFGMAKDEARRKYAFYSTRASFPDGGDIASMVLYSYIHQKVYWNTHIWNKPEQEHCIRGEYGVMTFKLTKKGIKYYTKMGDLLGEEYIFKQSGELLGGAVERFLENKDINISSVYPSQEIKALVETWDDAFLSLKFTPNEELGLELTRGERFAELFDENVIYYFSKT